MNEDEEHVGLDDGLREKLDRSGNGIGSERRRSPPSEGPQRASNRSFVPRDFAGGFDRRRQCVQRLCNRKERVLQKLRRIWPLFDFNLERLGEVIPERWRQVLGIRNRRCAVRGNQIKGLQRIVIEVGRFALDHLCGTRSSQ